MCVCEQPLVRPPGFEPGSSAWEADVLAKLDYGRNECENFSKREITNLNFYPLLFPIEKRGGKAKNETG